MPVIFEKKFYEQAPGQMEVREDGAVPFYVQDCGMGDLIMAMGFVEGYRSMGRESWIFTTQPAYMSLLRAFGEVPRMDSKGFVRMGGRSAFYGPFLKGGCDTHAMVEWIRTYLPDNPPWIAPKLKLSEEIREWADGWLTRCDLEESSEFLRQQEGPPVLLFPEANYGTRRSPENFWIDLAWELRYRGIRAVTMLRDSASEKAYPLTLSGRSLEQVAALISRAQFVIGQDSGPAHIAGALGVPTLALCGPTRNMFTHYPSVIEVHASPETVSCSGCWFNGDRGYRSACDFGCRALQHVTPEEVLDVIDKLPQPEGFLRPRLGNQPGQADRSVRGVPRSLVGVVRAPASKIQCVRRMGLAGEGDHPAEPLGDGGPGVRWVLDESPDDRHGDA